MPRRIIEVQLENGDHFRTWINGYRREILAYYYQNGGILNMGFGAGDNLQKIKRIRFL